MAVTEGPSALAFAGVVTVLAGLGGMTLIQPAGLSVLVLGGVLLFVAAVAVAAAYRDPGRTASPGE